MKKTFLLAVSALFVGLTAQTQEPVFPRSHAEDTKGYMSEEYWKIWNPEEMAQVYSDTLKLSEGISKLGIRDWLFERKPGYEAVALRGLGLLALLPLYIVSIIPTGLLFLIPRIFLKKMIKDQMFISTFNVAVSVFVSVPLCLILPVVLLWVFAGFWWALGYFIAFPLMFILSWNYLRLFWKFVGSCNFIRRKNRKGIRELVKLRKSIFDRLDAVIK